MRWLSSLPLLALTTIVGCRGPVAKIQAEHDALVADDAAKIAAATSGFASCPELQPVALKPKEKGRYDEDCLAEIANGFGSKKGFVSTPPDHASAATVALLLLRDGRGDKVAHADQWLNAIKAGRGLGQDTLRLAVARRMAEAAPLVGRAFTDADEAAARSAMKAIVAAIPGACPTYQLLGAGTDATKIDPLQSADHSACVFQDLTRRDGPGGKYGKGTFRAMEGAVAIWRDAERDLRLGLGDTDPAVRAVLEKKLALIEDASRKIVLPKQEMQSAASMFANFHGDAGLPVDEIMDASAGH